MAKTKKDLYLKIWAPGYGEAYSGTPGDARYYETKLPVFMSEPQVYRFMNRQDVKSLEAEYGIAIHAMHVDCKPVIEAFHCGAIQMMDVTNRILMLLNEYAYGQPESRWVGMEQPNLYTVTVTIKTDVTASSPAEAIAAIKRRYRCVRDLDIKGIEHDGIALKPDFHNANSPVPIWFRPGCTAGTGGCSLDPMLQKAGNCTSQAEMDAAPFVQCGHPCDGN